VVIPAAVGVIRPPAPPLVTASARIIRIKLTDRRPLQRSLPAANRPRFSIRTTGVEKSRSPQRCTRPAPISTTTPPYLVQTSRSGAGWWWGWVCGDGGGGRNWKADPADPSGPYDLGGRVVKNRRIDLIGDTVASLVETQTKTAPPTRAPAAATRPATDGARKISGAPPSTWAKQVATAPGRWRVIRVADLAAQRIKTRTRQPRRQHGSAIIPNRTLARDTSTP